MTSVHEPTELSDCHNAPVYTAEGAGVRVTEIRPGSTYYYACSECGQPCDTAPQPAAQELTKVIEAPEGYRVVPVVPLRNLRQPAAPTDGYWSDEGSWIIGSRPAAHRAGESADSSRHETAEAIQPPAAGEVEAILVELFLAHPIITGGNAHGKEVAEALQAIEAHITDAYKKGYSDGYLSHDGGRA